MLTKIKYSQICLILSCIFVIGGCSKNKENVTIVDHWPKEIEFQGKRVDLPLSEYITNRGYFAGDYLVFNAYKFDYCFLVYDRNFNLVDSVLRKGMGPQELPGAMFYGQWKGSDTNPEITIFSEPLNRIASIKLHPFGDLKTIGDIPSSSYISPSSIYEVNDTLYAGVSLEIIEGARLFTFNPATNQTEVFPLPLAFNEKNRFYTTQQSMAYNPQLQCYYTAYNSVPWVIIYDRDFKVLKKIAIGEEVDTETLTMDSNYPEMSMVEYFNNHILVMYWSNPETGDNNKLLVFDPKGKPEASISIGDAMGYIIDQKDKRLFTLHHDRDEDVIYLKEGDLPTFLRN